MGRSSSAKSLEEVLGAHRVVLAPMRLVVHEEDDGLGDGDGADPPDRPRGRKPATIPAWIHLTPAGPVVQGRDGRAFEVTDPQAVLDRTAPELPMLVDWDHDSMWGSTKAAAWVDALQFIAEGEESASFPETGFWGHVERWTPEGSDDVRNFRFRMVSPVIRQQFREPEIEGDEAPPPLILNFESIALTNRPNLRMVSLNTEGATGAGAHAMSEEEMAELLTLLGLEEGADGAAILEAVGDLVEGGGGGDEGDAENARRDLAAANASIRVLTSDLTTAREALVAHTAAAATADIEEQNRLVSLAISEGRGHETMRADLVKLATSDRPEDREMFTRLTAHRLAAAPRGRVTEVHGEARPDGSKVRRLSGHQAAVAALSESDQFEYRCHRGANIGHDKAMSLIAEGKN